MQAFTEREPFRIWCLVADRTGHGTHFMRHTHINSYWNLSFWLFDRNLLATQRKWPNMCTQQIPYPNYTNSIDLARSFGYSGIIVASYARIHFLNWFSLDSRFCSLHLFPFFPYVLFKFFHLEILLYDEVVHSFMRLYSITVIYCIRFKWIYEAFHSFVHTKIGKTYQYGMELLPFN